MDLAPKNTEKRFKKHGFASIFVALQCWMFQLDDSRVAWLLDRRRGRGTRGRGLTADDDLFGWFSRIDETKTSNVRWDLSWMFNV